MSTLAALANHLWQSTVFAGLVAIAILAFRRNRASVRHGLWLAASIKFLIPFAALVSLGAQLAPRVIAPSALPAIASAVGTASQPFASPRVEFPAGVLGDVAPKPTSSWPIAPMAASIWVAGSLLFLGVWGVQWRRMAKMVRTGARITSGREVDALRHLERQAHLAQPITIVESPGHFEPGVFGIRTPVLLWPAGIGAHLTSEQLVTILAHEVAHVRRRDNLTAAIQMVISSAFWFHPLVWWIGARLADERERACDEDVLHAGGEPEMYAETILAVCRLYLQAPPSCVSGVASSDLRTRIERIMTSAATRTLSWRHKLLLATVTIAALATPVAIGALTASTLRTPGLRFMQVQIQRRQVPNPYDANVERRMTFEISTVKLNPGAPGPVAINAQSDGRFTARNVTLKTLIQMAYRLQAGQIVDGPGWLNSDRFDVTAQTDVYGERMPLIPEGTGQVNRFNVMLQALLADRFKLVVRNDTREMPIYELRVASADGTLGPNFRQAHGACSQLSENARGEHTGGETVPCGILMRPGMLNVVSTPTVQLANSLSTILGRTVVDRTELSGSYDLTLKWTPDIVQPGPVDPNPVSIFAAIRDQLGLTLEPTKAPVDVLLIVSAEPPRTN